MYLVMARNVNDAYRQGAVLLNTYGVERLTRNGVALVLPRPCTTHYERPTERVLFNEARDANPFFQLFEALWLLAGRDDVRWISQFNRQIAAYSDDGHRFHGSYGERWRRHWGFDQLERLLVELTRDRQSRRAYLGMWDPGCDLGAVSKDLPCNVGAKVELMDGALNIVVFNRSNDMLWGAYGTNVVQFSMLQEYLAARLGAQVGWYEQVSANFHAYTNTWAKAGLNRPFAAYLNGASDPYELEQVHTSPLVTDASTFMRELTMFLEAPGDDHEWKNLFFQHVAQPLYQVHRYYRAGQLDKAERELDLMEPRMDWQLAARDWLARRREARARA